MVQDPALEGSSQDFGNNGPMEGQQTPNNTVSGFAPGLFPKQLTA
jgi:hypothetical protein